MGETNKVMACVKTVLMMKSSNILENMVSGGWKVQKAEPKRIYAQGTIAFRLSPDIGRQTCCCVNARLYHLIFGVSTPQR